MERPSILLLTRGEKLAQTFETNLRMFFGTNIQVYTVHEHGELDSKLVDECELILVSAESMLERLPKSFHERALFARRTVHLPNLEKLMDLAPGTRCLFVSNSMDTILDAIELLNRLGFDHLHFIPYVSQPTEIQPALEGIDVAVTHGLKELVPATIGKIIDLGIRPIDLTTIYDIAQQLNLPIENAHFYTAEFFSDFVRLGRNLANSVNNEKRLNQKLESVLNAVHEGIISMDECGDITVFNEEAEKILGLSAKNCFGKTCWDVVPEFNLNQIFQSHVEEANQLLEIRNKVLLVTKVPMIMDGHLMGVVVTFQDVTIVQRNEQEIRKNSSRLGLTTKYSFENIIGVSDSIISTKQVAVRLAESDFTVLITGENGTGKEVFAQAIHKYSTRRDGPFVPVNFAGLTESLAESELFGYEEGSFTGAKKGGKMGLFELAHNGTIFLDEIGDAPLSIQAALLRVLQERQVMRVGGNRVIPINVRVIAATNRNLNSMVSKGDFREDLYYRLNVLPLNIPNLRERQEDLFILIDFFLCDNGINLQFTPEVKNVLLNYSWPGNIRELENFVKYLKVIVEGNTVKLQHIPERILNNHVFLSRSNGVTAEAETVEREDILQFLSRHGSLMDYEEILTILWNISKRQERAGRTLLCSLVSRPLSEAQIRNKLLILKRCGCVAIGVKKQGTTITPIGIQVLQLIREKLIK
ncbi:sigma 54-interacting transcriptional regulator [Bacillus hominis]|uniref:Sigma 54-interacting transcriptional regulator n=1 Tax=Bacillus hominis TaxID=2817478 RepID=A0ABT7R999_9BACI|nr:sigma 54-interacting transcriptional regulator [Bacillus hominis]MDM5194388.1 sigma 54-interacting transcriptional regulator [Bacillus hominis]MDM5434091.1 sigma 54-interacting transcriptional regulator [Bacillus hominis]MDM5439513.1 sigma 54-interacting transcriptional regulator [Bacillus hominis]